MTNEELMRAGDEKSIKIAENRQYIDQLETLLYQRSREIEKLEKELESAIDTNRKNVSIATQELSNELQEGRKEIDRLHKFYKPSEDEKGKLIEKHEETIKTIERKFNESQDLEKYYHKKSEEMEAVLVKTRQEISEALDDDYCYGDGCRCYCCD